MNYQKHLLRVKENAAFILDQNTCRIRHRFDLQSGNIAGSFKRSDKVLFYECTRNDNGLLLSTEVPVVKEENDSIGGDANSRIAGKWCKRDEKFEHLLALVRKRSEHIEMKKQGKKRQICFILTLQEFNKYYYRLSGVENFSLTCSCMVVSYPEYPKSSVSKQLSNKETSNTNKKIISTNSPSH